MNVTECCAETNDKDESVNEEFHTKLYDSTDNQRKSKRKTMMGDLHAKRWLGSIDYKVIMGKHGPKVINS